MSTSRDPSSRTLMLVFAGVASVGVLIGAVALLVWAVNSGDRGEPTPPSNGVVAVNDPKATAVVPSNVSADAAPASALLKPLPGAKRFTLRLGQGFRFKDGVVVAKPQDDPDVVFKYVPPQLGGVSLRFNPVSKQLETKVDPALNSPAPLLVSTKVKAFDAKPDIAKTTSGDLAEFTNQAAIGPKTRYALLMNRAGDQYLLTLDELEAPLGRYDDWRVGFAYEPVRLPLGLAEGRINQPLPGKMIFRDWYHTKMIMRVDLMTGREAVIGDGVLPSTAGNPTWAYVDATGAYVLRDATDRTVKTLRFDEKVEGPLLSPDGTRVVGSVRRALPPIGGIGGASEPGVGVFDLNGREITSISGYDDATWTPDGKLIATGPYNDPGLFEIDPATKHVRPIDPAIGAAFSPNVSPDGKTIAFVTGGKAWLIGRDGKNLRQVFMDGHYQQRPAFSPDGTKVALVVCNLFASDGSGEVFVIDVTTGNVTRVRTSTGESLIPDTTSRLNWVP